VGVTPCQEAGRTDPVVVGGSLVVVLEVVVLVEVVVVEVVLEVVVLVEVVVVEVVLEVVVLEVVVLVVSGGALVVVEVVEVVVVAGTGSESPPQPAATSTTASSAGSHVLTATTLRQCARYQRAAFGNQAVMPKRSRPKQSMALPRMSL
jgi:hypothetical protein